MHLKRILQSVGLSRGFSQRGLIPRCFVFTNTAFIHIPKNGGQSISAVFYGHTIHHSKAYEIRRTNPSFYKNAFTFAVVRDPVERFKSAYIYLKNGGRSINDKKIAEKYLSNSLDEFIHILQAADFNNVPELFHFHTQSSYVTEPKYQKLIIVDRIYKLDNLNPLFVDFKSYSRQLPLLESFPRINSTKSGDFELTKQQKEKVKTIYNIDYVNFF